MKITITALQARYLLTAINICTEELQPPNKEEAEIITSLQNIDTDESYRKTLTKEME